jgi:uncharacterized membrane protein YsdA (DUF1294 family)/cold shock CspA family protein
MESSLKAKIVEWDRVKGYGCLQSNGRRLFLHRRDFAERHKRPEVGDVIQFQLGTDMKGRPCAVNAVHLNDGGKITLPNLFCIVLLLTLPLLVLYRLGTLGLYAAGYGAVIATLTFILYRHDKNRARTGGWRVSEKTLHFFELIGGWPGAFLAQRHLRHKCSTAGFQTVFWCIVFGDQFAAFDCTQDWKITQLAAKELTAIMRDSNR